MMEHCGISTGSLRSILKVRSRARAGYWIARAMFDKNDVPGGCSAISDALARTNEGDAELRNQITYLNQRCAGVVLPGATSTATAPVTTTPPVSQTVTAAPPTPAPVVEAPPVTTTAEAQRDTARVVTAPPRPRASSCTTTSQVDRYNAAENNAIGAAGTRRSACYYGHWCPRVVGSGCSVQHQAAGRCDGRHAQEERI